MRALSELSFSDWLLQEVERRGLTYSELARRGGTTPARVSQVISGDKPGWDFCLAVARAFGEPPEKIFRLAGLLPPEPGDDDLDITADELQAINLLREAKGKPKVGSGAFGPNGDQMTRDFWRIWKSLLDDDRLQIIRLARKLAGEREVVPAQEQAQKQPLESVR